MSQDVIEGEVIEHKPPAVRQSSEVVTWVPSFAIAVDEAVQRVEAKRDFYNRVMRPGEHYGPIPGTKAREGEEKPKDVLFKAGAELLLANMALQAEFSDADEPTIDYGEEGREGLIRYRRVCRIFRQTGPHEEDRMQVARAEGSCSSRETKYRWRNEDRLCPVCGKPTIIKGKAEYGGGWLCWKKSKNGVGCGTTWPDGATEIESQVVGKVANPDLADLDNTVLKMADKRALVAATLIATGCSDIFTQDIADDEDPPEPPAPKPGAKTAAVADKLKTVRPTENAQSVLGNGGSSPGPGASRDAQTPPAHVETPEASFGERMKAALDLGSLSIEYGRTLLRRKHPTLYADVPIGKESTDALNPVQREAFLKDLENIAKTRAEAKPKGAAHA